MRLLPLLICSNLSHGRTRCPDGAGVTFSRLVSGDHLISYPPGPGKAIISFPLCRHITASRSCMLSRPQMAGRLDPHPVATFASNVSNEVGSSTLSTAAGMVALWSHGVASDPTPVTFSRGRGVNVVLWPKGSDLLLKSLSVLLPIKLILDPRSMSMDDLPSGSFVGDLLGSLM